MEAEHVARVRTLLPGQEEATETTPIAAPAELPKPLIPTVQEPAGRTCAATTWTATS